MGSAGTDGERCEANQTPMPRRKQPKAAVASSIRSGLHCARPKVLAIWRNNTVRRVYLHDLDWHCTQFFVTADCDNGIATIAAKLSLSKLSAEEMHLAQQYCIEIAYQVFLLSFHPTPPRRPEVFYLVQMLPHPTLGTSHLGERYGDIISPSENGFFAVGLDPLIALRPLRLRFE